MDMPNKGEVWSDGRTFFFIVNVEEHPYMYDGVITSAPGIDLMQLGRNFNGFLYLKSFQDLGFKKVN